MTNQTIPVPREVLEQVLDTLGTLRFRLGPTHEHALPLIREQLIKRATESITDLKALLDAPSEPLTGKCGQCKSSKVPCGCNTGVPAGIKALLSAPSEPTCKCSIRIKLVGDGCSVCNPEHWSEDKCERCGAVSMTGLSLCEQCNKD